MSEYDNTNRGVLFTNDRKASEKHPDFNGTLDVGGAQYWISGWMKTGKRGKFVSLSVKPKEANPITAPASGQSAWDEFDNKPDAPAQVAPAGAAIMSADDDSDEIPF